MKLKALLRSLLLALLVFITGCGTSRTESGTAAPQPKHEAAPVRIPPAVEPVPAAPPVGAHDERNDKADGLQESVALTQDNAGSPAPPRAMVMPAMGKRQMTSMTYMPAPMPIQPMPGDFNTENDFSVGTVNQEALKTMIQEHRKSGVALTTLGFGHDNYNDALAGMLADVGNGSHH